MSKYIVERVESALGTKLNEREVLIVEVAQAEVEAELPVGKEDLIRLGVKSFVWLCKVGLMVIGAHHLVKHIL